MIIVKEFFSTTWLTRLTCPNYDIDEDTVETICSLNVKLASSITPRSHHTTPHHCNRFQFLPPKERGKSHLPWEFDKLTSFVLSGLSKS